MESPRKRIVVVGDTRIYREALVEFLTRRTAFDVVGEFAVLGTTVDAVAELGPNLVVIDGRSRGGPDLSRQLIARVPRLQIVAAGVPEEAETLVPWARAGVHGFVLDGEGTAGLETVIHAVTREGFSCPRRITGQLLRRLGNARTVYSPTDALTVREREVAGLLDQGLTNKEIAKRLGIGAATVKNHVHNILEKLDLRRRGEAAALVRRELGPPGSLIGVQKGG
jgi:DNA-binding NarL/FixJ family response regulator